ncbi:23S rRNA (guanosine(2251)-2'-O)-methyltransferase RlmB [Dongia sp.]|uniref:23S rRNA (guanosine(2251)-2'-O)-methyltransferase RlmB n=1 Tax=Dongia sp. TaxID=1977262 RepID=UPI0037520D66
MPPRKPFRPDKNRDRGRSPHGARDPESGHPGKNRDNRSQEKKRAPGTWAGQDRPRADERASPPRYSSESGSSKPQRDPHASRDEAQAGYKASGGSYWIYGNHAVAAAIDNPQRRIRRLLQAHPDAEKAARGAGDRPLPRWETVDRAILDRVAGRESVHQGIAAQVDPLPETDVEDIAALAAARPEAKIVILDQVTDPHNVGAILRSAAAFGALAVVLTERNAAPESGVLAKAASGALEVVPLVRVTNLARAIEQLKAAGFWCAGLAAEGERSLAEARLSGRVALCLGAEGAGLRRLTRSHCDLLVRLPTSGPIGHLNVSNAAAIGLYELSRAG